MTKRSSPAVHPPAPVKPIAVAVGDCEVLLAWTECQAGEHGFRIERADGIGSACRFSEIGGVGAHVAAFRDGTVKPRTIYSYRVHAWNPSGNSLPSDVVEVTTSPADTEPPAF